MASETYSRLNISVRVAPVTLEPEEYFVTYKGSKKEICLMDPRSVSIEQLYEFSHVYPPEVPQEEVFEQTCRPLIEGALEGSNACYFAYGQVRSGKTFTVFGGPAAETAGMVERTLMALTEAVKAEPRLSLSMSLVDISQEKIKDLLKGEGAYLGDVVELTVEGDHFAVQDTNWHPVPNFEAANEKLKAALLARNTQTGPSNPLQLSHTLFMIRLNHPHLARSPVTYLCMGDLARCERSRRESVFEARANPLHISSVHNSFTSLIRVVDSLAKTGQAGVVIPYKESLLTSFASAALRGNWLFSLMACINPLPRLFDECVNVMQFATKLKIIESKVASNSKLSKEDESKQLDKRIKNLRQDISEMRFQMDQMEFLHSKDLKELALKLGLDFDLELLRLEDPSSREIKTVRNMREAMERTENLKMYYERLQSQAKYHAQLLAEIRVVAVSNQEKQEAELVELQHDLSNLKLEIEHYAEVSASPQFSKKALAELDDMQKLLFHSHLQIEQEAAEINSIAEVQSKRSELAVQKTEDRRAGREAVESMCRHEYRKQEDELEVQASRMEDGYQTQIDKKYKEMTRIEQNFKRFCYEKMAVIERRQDECARLCQIVRKQQQLLEAIKRGDYNHGIVPVLIPRTHQPHIPEDILAKHAILKSNLPPVSVSTPSIRSSSQSVSKVQRKVNADPETEEKRGPRHQGLAAMQKVKLSITALTEAHEDLGSRTAILHKVHREIAELELERDRYKALAREEHQRNRVSARQNTKVVLETQAEHFRGFFLTSVSPRGLNYTPESTTGRPSLSRLSLSKGPLTQTASPRSVVSSQSHRLLLKA